MSNFDFSYVSDPSFVNRKIALQWLDDHLLDRTLTPRHIPLYIAGPGGVGKTSLVRYWLSSRYHTYTPLWVDLYSSPDALAMVEEFTKNLYEKRRRGNYIVVIDGMEMIPDGLHHDITLKIFNLKAVRSLIFTTRRFSTHNKSETFELGPLTSSDTAELLKLISPVDLTQETIDEIFRATRGLPLAISLISNFLQSGNMSSVQDILQGRIYELSQEIIIPSTEIAIAVAPSIIKANSILLAAIQKQPKDLYSLTPRKFEELIAELLLDMGWEVELTQQTRDGGKDILAYMNTDLGRLLCLVEAKHYREDRKVGIDIVRTLYGTLCDAQANSGILVTSSTFTPDAREFQQRHNYQLSLRDYTDIIAWITKYNNKKIS